MQGVKWGIWGLNGYRESGIIIYRSCRVVFLVF
jgi:hypothetical protein